MPDDWFSANAPTEAPGGDWFATNAPEPERETPENRVGGLGAIAATGAAAVPVVQRVAEHVATSPTLGRMAGALSKRIAPLNIAKQAYDVATGRQSLAGGATDAALGEGARRLLRPGAQLAQRIATPIAGMSAPLVAGGLAGVAGTAGFLGALQHDANRTVDIDYSKNTPDTAIAKVFSNMRDSEKNRGKTLAERQDDPNDVMFAPDDTETVTAAPAGGSRVSDAVRAFFGSR